MTTKCANPACTSPFHYFRSGKIFLIDVAAWNGGSRPPNTPRDIEYFWLCGDCSQTMQVTLDQNGCVVVEQTASGELGGNIVALPSPTRRVVRSVA